MIVCMPVCCGIGLGWKVVLTLQVRLLCSAGKATYCRDKHTGPSDTHCTAYLPVQFSNMPFGLLLATGVADTQNSKAYRAAARTTAFIVTAVDV